METAGFLELQRADPEAAAAVAIGSLSYAATLQALTGRLPGTTDEDRYFEAWVNQTVSVLAQYTNRRKPLNDNDNDSGAQT